jgi:hypothetical protein
MEQRPSKANSHSDSLEIRHLLWKPKVHFRFHKSPVLDPKLNQMNPFYTFQTFKIHFNIILPSMPQIYIEYMFYHGYPFPFLYLCSLFRNSMTLSPTQWVSGDLSPGEKRSQRESDHSPALPRLRMRGA